MLNVDYYVRANAWAITNKSLVVKALAEARRPWQAWKGTYWTDGLMKSGPVDRGGIPPAEFSFDNVKEFSEDLQKCAHLVHQKGQGLLLSHTQHKELARGGHANSDCAKETGILMDCDERSDPGPLHTHLQAAGLAHMVIVKPISGKFHIPIPILPRNPDAYSLKHNALYRHVIGLLAGLGDVVLDPKMGDGLMHVEYAPHRVEESDPVPVVRGYEGGLLDLDAFARATGFVAPSGVKGSLPIREEDALPRVDPRPLEEVLAHVRLALSRAHRSPFNAREISVPAAAAALLAGKVFAKKGQRELTMLILANIAGASAPDSDPEVIVEHIFLPSLKAMEEEDPGNAPVSKTFDMVSERLQKGQDYGRRKRAADEAFRSALLRAC